MRKFELDTNIVKISEVSNTPLLIQNQSIAEMEFAFDGDSTSLATFGFKIGANSSYLHDRSRFPGPIYAKAVSGSGNVLILTSGV